MGRCAARRTASLAAALAAAAGFVAPAGATTIPSGANTSTTTVGFPNGGPPFTYSPDVLAVDRSGAGPAQVNWSGSSFGSHPLRFEDPSVAGQSFGASTGRDLRSGRYAYYCSIHGGPNGSGMSGEVYVQGPRAALKATPADIAPGATVTLSAADTDLVSFAGSGLTATYAFDPEGDGTFLPAGSATTMQATYTAEGQPTAQVRVTDSQGRTDEASVTIDVAVPGTSPPPQTPPPGDPPPGTSGTPASETGPGTGNAPRRARFADVATLPRFGRCVNRRRGVRIRVADAAGADVRSVRVLIDGRTVRRRAVGRRTTLRVRPLPGRRPLLKVVVTLAGGTKLTRSIRYRTCRG